MDRGSAEFEPRALTAPHPPSSKPKDKGHLRVVPLREPATVLELLSPGSFVTLDSQPNDLPPFELIHCKRGRCWVRQQAWGKYVHWEVEHRRLTSA